MGRGSSPGTYYPFLLALHTILAADVAKLGVYRAHTHRGDAGARTSYISSEHEKTNGSISPNPHLRTRALSLSRGNLPWLVL